MILDFVLYAYVTTIGSWAGHLEIQELKKLQGVWTPIAGVVRFGKLVAEVPESELKALSMRIKGKSVLASLNGERQPVVHIGILPQFSPTRMVVSKADPQDSYSYSLIYKIENGLLFMAFGNPSHTRLPKSFDDQLLRLTKFKKD
jgi:uncharacterized protein (TIGR03067 family)